MKKIIIIIFSIIATYPVFSQRNVSLVVSADGASKTEAINNALRNAIEQTYGTFVSSNTTILNDELVKDEIATVASGNIKKYREVSSIVTNDNRHWVTLDVTVSLNKLIKFAKGKGEKCELAGAEFSANCRMYEFNRTATEKAYENLYKTIELAGSSLFDYKMKVSEPYTTNGHTFVHATVHVKANHNAVKMRNYIINTLYSLSTSRKNGSNNKKHGFDMYFYKMAMSNDAYGNCTRCFYVPIDIKRINNALNNAAASYVIEDNLLNKYSIEPTRYTFVSGGTEYLMPTHNYQDFHIKLSKAVKYSYSFDLQIDNIDKVTDIELQQPNTPLISLPNNHNIRGKLARWQFFALYNRQTLGNFERLYFDRFTLDDVYDSTRKGSNGLSFGLCKRMGFYGKINWGQKIDAPTKKTTDEDSFSQLNGMQLIGGIMFRCSDNIHCYLGAGHTSFNITNWYYYETDNPYCFEWDVTDKPSLLKDLTGYVLDAGLYMHYWYMTFSFGGTYYLSTQKVRFNFGVGICL